MMLAACGQGDKAPADARGGDANTAAAAAPSAKAAEKYSAYSEGFNELIGTFGVAYQYDRYQKQNVDTAGASATINFPSNVTLLERALGKIKEGRALNGGNETAAADAAADKIIQHGDALLAQWKELAPYYETRAYRDDALAKGKGAHAALVAAFEGTLAGIDELDTVLTEQSRQHNVKRIADLRKAGEDNAANLLEATHQAEMLVSKALEDDIAGADALLPKVDEAVAKLRGSQAKMDDGNIEKAYYSMASDALTTLIGNYRDLKQSPDDRKKEAGLNAYNEAITNLNRISMPGRFTPTP